MKKKKSQKKKFFHVHPFVILRMQPSTSNDHSSVHMLRKLIDWSQPDLPLKEIATIMKEKKYGNEDLCDFLTRVFSCTYFNEALPQNHMIQRYQESSLVLRVRTGWAATSWGYESTSHIMQHLISVFLPILKLELPHDFDHDKLEQNIMSVIDAGSRCFGDNPRKCARCVDSIVAQFGEGAIEANDKYEAIIMEDLIIGVGSALYWVQEYECLCYTREDVGLRKCRLYLYDTDRLTQGSLRTMLRTLFDAQISLYFYDDHKGSSECVLNTENVNL